MILLLPVNIRSIFKSSYYVHISLCLVIMTLYSSQSILFNKLVSKGCFRAISCAAIYTMNIKQNKTHFQFGHVNQCSTRNIHISSKKNLDMSSLNTENCSEHLLMCNNTNHGNNENSNNYKTQVIQWVSIMLILCGNTLTISVIYKYKYLRTKTNALVCSLSFGDLFVGISLIPETVFGIFNAYDANSLESFIFFSIKQTGYMISVSHIAFVASERYIYVMYPLRYHSLVTVNLIKCILCICWTLPVLLGITSVLIILLLGKEYFKYFEIASNILYLTVGLIATWVYTRILHVVAKQRQRILAEQNVVTMETGGSKMATQGPHKSTLALGIVVIMYVVLWSPMCVITLLFYFGVLKENSVIENCFIVGSTLASLNSAVNCFIYAWKNSGFRKAYKRLFSCD